MDILRDVYYVIFPRIYGSHSGIPYRVLPLSVLTTLTLSAAVNR